MLSQEEKKAFIAGYCLSTMDDQRVPKEHRYYILEQLSNPILAEIGLEMESVEDYFKFWRELEVIGKILRAEIT